MKSFYKEHKKMLELNALKLTEINTDTKDGELVVILKLKSILGIQFHLELDRTDLEFLSDCYSLDEDELAEKYTQD